MIMAYLGHRIGNWKMWKLRAMLIKKFVEQVQPFSWIRLCAALRFSALIALVILPDIAVKTNDDRFYLLIAEVVDGGAEVVQLAEVLNLLLLDPVDGTWKRQERNVPSVSD